MAPTDWKKFTGSESDLLSDLTKAPQVALFKRVADGETFWVTTTFPQMVSQSGHDESTGADFTHWAEVWFPDEELPG